MDPTLVASSLGASVAAGIFLSAGLLLRGRAVAGDDALAVQTMTLWWMGLSLYALGSACIDLLVAVGADALAVVLAVHYAQIVALCIGLWGLMYHIAYLFTGNRRLLAPLAAFYALYYAALVFLLTAGRPSGVDADPWPRLSLADPVLAAVGIALLLAIPPLVAGGTYLTLYPKASGPRRLRVALVSAGVVAWFLGALAREATPRSLAAPILLGALAACAVSWAYAPPRWARRRWGVAG